MTNQPRIGYPTSLDVAATRTATPIIPSWTQSELASSLACYCSDDDVYLSRKEFLQTISDRIYSDLLNDEY